jgi:hypothetical protein
MDIPKSPNSSSISVLTSMPQTSMAIRLSSGPAKRDLSKSLNFSSISALTSMLRTIMGELL